MKKIFIFIVVLIITGCKKEETSTLDLDYIFPTSYSCDIYFQERTFYNSTINTTQESYGLSFRFYNIIEDIDQAAIFYRGHKLKFQVYSNETSNIDVLFDSLANHMIQSSTLPDHLFLFRHQGKSLELRFKKNSKIEFSISNPNYFTYFDTDYLFYNNQDNDMQITTNLVDVVGNGNFAKGLIFFLDTIDSNGAFKSANLDKLVQAQWNRENILTFPNDSAFIHRIGVFSAWIYFANNPNSIKQTYTHQGDQITITQELPLFVLPFRFYKF